jgi:hypothetical protein
MAVTLSAGSVSVTVEPVTGMVPAETGWTGVPPVDWVCAEGDVEDGSKYPPHPLFLAQ